MNLLALNCPETHQAYSHTYWNIFWSYPETSKIWNYLAAMRHTAKYKSKWTFYQWVIRGTMNGTSKFQVQHLFAAKAANSLDLQFSNPGSFSTIIKNHSFAKNPYQLISINMITTSDFSRVNNRSTTNDQPWNLFDEILYLQSVTLEHWQ